MKFYSELTKNFYESPTTNLWAHIIYITASRYITISHSSMWDYGHPCGFLVRQAGFEPTTPCFFNRLMIKIFLKDNLQQN